MRVYSKMLLPSQMLGLSEGDKAFIKGFQDWLNNISPEVLGVFDELINSNQYGDQNMVQPDLSMSSPSTIWDQRTSVPLPKLHESVDSSLNDELSDGLLNDMLKIRDDEIAKIAISFQSDESFNVFQKVGQDLQQRLDNPQQAASSRKKKAKSALSLKERRRMQRIPKNWTRDIVDVNGQVKKRIEFSGRGEFVK